MCEGEGVQVAAVSPRAAGPIKAIPSTFLPLRVLREQLGLRPPTPWSLRSAGSCCADRPPAGASSRASASTAALGGLTEQSRGHVGGGSAFWVLGEGPARTAGRRHRPGQQGR